MSGVLPIDELVVPADATTLEGFRRWRRTLGENAPKVHFIDADLWFDMRPQELPHAFASAGSATRSANPTTASTCRRSEPARAKASLLLRPRG